MPIIGAHVSAAGGLKNAVKNAQAIGATAIQIFGASPRSWQANIPAKSVIDEYRSAIKDSGLGPVFLHAAYLPNLASPSRATFAMSVKCLAAHLTITEAIGAQGLIFHPGSGKEMDKAKALKQVAEGMKAILKLVPGTAQLIVENTAGGGSKVGALLDDLAFFLKKVNNSRVKICLDTAHALEGGIIKEYSKKEIATLFDDFDKKIGIKSLVALHLNDSKTPFNSHHDRHENIGQGHIGLNGFKNLAQEKRISHLPWLMEVPGFDDEGPDKKNVDILKKIISQK